MTNYFQKYHHCPRCDGIGKILNPTQIIISLPRTHPLQGGYTCPVCNGLRRVPDNNDETERNPE